MRSRTLKLEVDVCFTPQTLAQAFCQMNDEDQAQFFIECAKIAQTWQEPGANTLQWWLVSKHLVECSCSNEDARHMVRELSSAFKEEKVCF